MRRLRVALVTGSEEGDGCGVADYSWRLADALERAGVAAQVFVLGGPELSFQSARAIADGVPTSGLLHLQYPAVGYGRGLWPQYVIKRAASPTVLTLHEFTESSRLRQIASANLARQANTIVATSTVEASAIARIRNDADIRVIPVASNIPSRTPVRPHVYDVAYFGLVRPHRGLESFVQMVRILRGRTGGESVRVAVIGQADPRRLPYAHVTMRELKTLGVSWFDSLPAHDVSEILRRTATAYLPYPSGASLRRASLLAAMANGVAVVTTHGASTPQSLYQAVAFADDPVAAAEVVAALLERPRVRSRLTRGSMDIAREHTWGSIAAKHVAAYASISAGRGRIP